MAHFNPAFDYFYDEYDIGPPLLQKVWIPDSISWLKSLRVGHTLAISILRSMSERVGSDAEIEWRWNWMMNFLIDSKSIEDSNSESLYKMAK